LVHLSRDAGQSWEVVTPPDLPDWALISIIEPSPHDPAVAYIAATRYKLDDYRPYLYKTADYGESWIGITAGIGAGDFTRVIREDPQRRGLLYAGTETGVYVSFDDGGLWQRVGGDFPIVPVYDLLRKDDDLVVATHGRSFWILDDVVLLHQLLAPDAGETGQTRLFRPADAIRRLGSLSSDEDRVGIDYGYAGPLVYGYRPQRRPDGSIRKIPLDAGLNPDSGVCVSYFLEEPAPDRVTLRFLTGSGDEMRSFDSRPGAVAPPVAGEAATLDLEEEALNLGLEGEEGESSHALLARQIEAEQAPVVPNAPGLNRFAWDMRCSPAVAVADEKSIEAALLAGPTVLPGPYQVELSVGDQRHLQAFEIRSDPGLTISPDQQRAQFQLLTSINTALNETNAAINGLRDVRSQLDAWEKRLQSRPRNPESAGESNNTPIASLRRLRSRLNAIEDRLTRTEPDTGLHYTAELRLSGKLAALKAAVDFTDAAPTTQAFEVYSELSSRIDEQLAALRGLLDSDLADLNQLLRDEVAISV
ncbi:MAG: glycosyl hydrolase, partial [Chloroflexota bacterium]